MKTSPPELEQSLEILNKKLENVYVEMKLLKQIIDEDVYQMFSMIQDFIKPSENLTIKVEKTFLLIKETLSFLEEPDGIVFSYFSTSLNMLVDIVDSAAAFATLPLRPR